MVYCWLRSKYQKAAAEAKSSSSDGRLCIGRQYFINHFSSREETARGWHRIDNIGDVKLINFLLLLL